MAKKKYSFNINTDDYEEFYDDFESFDNFERIKKSNPAKDRKDERSKTNRYDNDRRDKQLSQDIYQNINFQEEKKVSKNAKSGTGRPPVRKVDEGEEKKLFSPAPQTSRKNYQTSLIKQEYKKPEDKKEYKPTESKPQVFQYGPNTREIRGFKIDYDRVKEIEKINGEYNGNPSYGIKFIFVSSKGTFKIVWFGRNERERDNTFVNERIFWEKISQ